jgi:hypothetical protein
VIAPTSDGGMYYTEPSEDWSRPGRMCWSVPDGVEAFSTWKEVTVVYTVDASDGHLDETYLAAICAPGCAPGQGWAWQDLSVTPGTPPAT